MTKYKACICEGGAERVILNLLLDQDKLIIAEKVTSFIDVKCFSFEECISEKILTG